MQKPWRWILAAAGLCLITAGYLLSRTPDVLDRLRPLASSVTHENTEWVVMQMPGTAARMESRLFGCRNWTKLVFKCKPSEVFAKLPPREIHGGTAGVLSGQSVGFGDGHIGQLFVYTSPMTDGETCEFWVDELPHPWWMTLWGNFQRRFHTP